MIEHIPRVKFEDTFRTCTRLEPDPTPSTSRKLRLSDYIVIDEGRMLLGRRLSISSSMCYLQDGLHKTGFINCGSGLLDPFAVDQ